MNACSSAMLARAGCARPASMLFAAAILLVTATGAHAAYCSVPSTFLCDGCTAHGAWKVVVSSFPRHEMIPGVKNNRIWCRETRRSLGGHSRNRIVQAPKLGVLRASGYDIRYKGDRVDRDRVVIERMWLSPTNKWNKGTLIYDIEVVDKPF